MISEKLKNMESILLLASAKGIDLNIGLVRMMRRQLSGIITEVRALENAQVPTAQRVTLKDIESGKITYISREVPFQ